jgi:RND family efflux transporter MFP subunit
MMIFSASSLSPGLKRLILVSVIVLAAAVIWKVAHNPKDEGGNKVSPVVIGAKQTAGAKPALTVTAVTPQRVEWPQMLAANGNIAAWQEAVISTEISNFRLTDVRVNVGDKVRKGQVLARISNDTVESDLAQSKATVAEAEAMLAEARANGDRARQFQATGFISAQQITQYLTAEKTALARLNAARARMQADQLRLAQTTVRAPDGGVISARAATVGSMAQPGQELFRLIRGSRLEWRAEVSAADLAKLKPGMVATLTTPSGLRVQGRVRMVAPTVDPLTLNGLVYVDLPISQTGDTVRAGTFARGEFELGRAPALALPQSAVLLRDGFAYVFRLDEQNKVAQTKVTVGRRAGDQIEITDGIAPEARVVASGAGFLADGDSVRVVDAPATAVSAQK